MHLLVVVCCWITPVRSTPHFFFAFLPEVIQLPFATISNAVVWVSAASNKHYLVAFTALMVLVSLTIQPLASAVLVVKNTWIQLPGALR